MGEAGAVTITPLGTTEPEGRVGQPVGRDHTLGPVLVKGLAGVVRGAGWWWVQPTEPCLGEGAVGMGTGTWAVQAAAVAALAAVAAAQHSTGSLRLRACTTRPNALGIAWVGRSRRWVSHTLHRLRLWWQLAKF